MKWTSLFFVLSCLWWTWAKITEPHPVPFVTHAALQRELRLWLEQKIKQQNPNLQSFSIKNIWTKNTTTIPEKPQQIEATLDYSFVVTGESGPIEQSGQLKVHLESQPQTNKPNEPEKWLIKSQELGPQFINFSEAEVVSLPATEETKNSAPPKSQE